MFRITSHIAGDEHVLKLEGCLDGACGRELDACWQEAARTSGRRIRVDLRDVCHINDEGLAFVTAMYRAGARFATKGCFMTELIREISEAVAADRTRDRAGRNVVLAAEARCAERD